MGRRVVSQALLGRLDYELPAGLVSNIAIDIRLQVCLLFNNACWPSIIQDTDYNKNHANGLITFFEEDL